MCLRAKDHLEGTKVAVSPRYCAPQKVQTDSAAAGGHRRVATRETTGDLATRRGAGDPETRAEWMKVLRYDHLRSAPVVVDVGVRTEWEPPTLRAASPRASAPPRWHAASPTTRKRVWVATDLNSFENPEGRARCTMKPSQSNDKPSGCPGRCATSSSPEECARSVRVGLRIQVQRFERD